MNYNARDLLGYFIGNRQVSTDAALAALTIFNLIDRKAADLHWVVSKLDHKTKLPVIAYKLGGKGYDGYSVKVVVTDPFNSFALFWESNSANFMTTLRAGDHMLHAELDKFRKIIDSP